MTQVEITDADREAAADILDELSSLLDHNSIGQVADLIRDGEYDEHDTVVRVATHRQAADRAGYERGVRESAGVAETMYVKDAFRFEFGHAVATAILALIPTTGGEEVDTIGSHFGNGGTFDPTCPKASSQD